MAPQEHLLRASVLQQLEIDGAHELPQTREGPGARPSIQASISIRVCVGIKDCLRLDRNACGARSRAAAAAAAAARNQVLIVRAAR
jgi:hypothetical protein